MHLRNDAENAAIDNISSSDVTCSGNVTDGGSHAVTARGVCWNTSGTPTITNSKTTDGTGTGTFSSTLSCLEDVYYEVVQTVAPINACGLFGIVSPGLVMFGLLAMKRRGYRR